MNIGSLGALGADGSAREASLRRHIQAAGSIESAAEGHDASDRDADGRQPWLVDDADRHDPSSDDENSDPSTGHGDAPSIDPTRQRGGKLDLSG